MDGYEALADAIILQAVKDYRILRQRLREWPSNKKTQDDMDKVKRFFYSRWFRQLTNIDPDLLLKGLREEDVP